MIAVRIKRNFSNAMGRSQVVRQRFLIPPPVGSNPAAPTNPFIFKVNRQVRTLGSTIRAKRELQRTQK